MQTGITCSKSEKNAPSTHCQVGPTHVWSLTKKQHDLKIGEGGCHEEGEDEAEEEWRRLKEELCCLLTAIYGLHPASRDFAMESTRCPLMPKSHSLMAPFLSSRMFEGFTSVQTTLKWQWKLHNLQVFCIFLWVYFVHCLFTVNYSQGRFGWLFPSPQRGELWYSDAQIIFNIGGISTEFCQKCFFHHCEFFPL